MSNKKEQKTPGKGADRKDVGKRTTDALSLDGFHFTIEVLTPPKEGQSDNDTSASPNKAEGEVLHMDVEDQATFHAWKYEERDAKKLTGGLCPTLRHAQKLLQDAIAGKGKLSVTLTRGPSSRFLTLEIQKEDEYAPHRFELVIQAREQNETDRVNRMVAALSRKLVSMESLPRVASWKTTQTMTTGHKNWNTPDMEAKTLVTLGGDNYTFTIQKAGIYRISCKVNGSTSGANSDHIALYVNGAQVSRSFVGMNTGYYAAFHLNEVVRFAAGSTFSIYQQINSNNLGSAIDNSLCIELIP